MGGEWGNQFGMMKLADFKVGKTLHPVSWELLDKKYRNSSERFLATYREFKQRALPTDELFHYDSEQSEWERGFGSEGYALVRDGELVDTLVIKIS